jgi:hypothetical protein
LSALPLRNRPPCNFRVEPSYLPFPAPSPSFLTLTFPNETELGCSFTLCPSWQISYKRDFRVLYSLDVSQLIKILLSQGLSPGIAHIRNPFQKSFLPLPRCISAHISQAYCMHAHMHNAYPIPRTATAHPRFPRNSIGNVAPSCNPHAAYLTLPYLTLPYICASPLPIHFSLHNLSPPRHSTQSTFSDPSFNIRLLLALVETSCNGMPDGLHTLRLQRSMQKGGFRLSAECCRAGSSARGKKGVG